MTHSEPLSGPARSALAWISTHGPVSVAELAQRPGHLCTERRAAQLLAELRRAGAVRRSESVARRSLGEGRRIRAAAMWEAVTGFDPIVASPKPRRTRLDRVRAVLNCLRDRAAESAEKAAYMRKIGSFGACNAMAHQRDAYLAAAALLVEALGEPSQEADPQDAP